MIDTPQNEHAKQPPDIGEGAERGEHSPRTLLEAMARAQWIVGEALVAQADPTRSRAGRKRKVYNGDDRSITEERAMIGYRRTILTADVAEGLPTDEEPNAGSMKPVAENDAERKPTPVERDAEAMAEVDRAMGERESHDRRET